MRLPGPFRIGALALSIALASGAAPAEEPLEVVATLPDLGSLVGEIGGEAVSVTVLAKGVQDPHFVEPRPSFIRRLHDADLFVLNGMDLEIGWAPVLLRSARNPRVLAGAPGHLDASRGITALEIPEGPLDRSHGDLHPFGNPHYLTDPVNALPVAAAIRERLTVLRPAAAETFRDRHDVFVRRLVVRLVGPELAAAHGAATLAQVLAEDRLEAWLREHDDASALDGWLGATRQLEGVRAVEDHQLWAYFARRFGLRLVARLEPYPGIAPTTRHLAEVVARVRTDQVPLILSSVYFDPRHARWVAERTGARVVRLAHQPGALPGTADYLATVDRNVRSVLTSLGRIDDASD